MQKIKFLILTCMTIVLSACSSLSLAGDITPPPGSNQPAVQPTQGIQDEPAYPLVPADPTIGNPIFNEKCAPCHGESGMGDGFQADQLPKTPAALVSTDVLQKAIPADWFTLISKGDLERFMPPFNSISEPQRWDVIAYIYSMAAPDDELIEGEKLYLDNCTSCHGETGEGDGSQASAFEDQMPDFTDLKWMAETPNQALHQSITNGISPNMPSFSNTLSEDQRWTVVSFLRALTFAGPSEPSDPAEGPTSESETTPEPTTAPTPTEKASVADVVTGQLAFISGEKPLDGMVITLRGFDDMQETISMSTTIQSDGSFRFTNVDMPLGRVFVASTEFEGVTYGSDIAMVEDETASLELPIPIFGSTDDSSVLSADRTHIFFEYQEPDTLHVVEIYIISNPSDRTVVAAQEGELTVEFKLPEGATNLQFEDGVVGGRYMLTSEGFGDTTAIRPGAGQHQITFGYEMPYDGKVELSQSVNLPTNAVVILIPKDGLKIKGEQLEYTGARDVQGITYEMYTGNRIEAGTDLAITVSGRPGGGGISLESESSTSLVIGLAALGLVLIGAGIWLYRRSQQDYTDVNFIDEDVEKIAPINDVPDDPEAVMDAIIALDDLYQAGELPEEAYKQRREVLKDQLREMVD